MYRKLFFLAITIIGIFFAMAVFAQTCDPDFPGCAVCPPRIYQGINCGSNWYCGGCISSCFDCPRAGDPTGATILNYVSCTCQCPSGQIVCSGACTTAPTCPTPTREQDNSSCTGCGACKAGYSPDPLNPNPPSPCLKTAYMDYANTGYFQVSSDIKSTGGDLYLASGKAIRIDAAGNATLNIGNWGGGSRFDLNLYGGGGGLNLQNGFLTGAYITQSPWATNTLGSKNALGLQINRLFGATLGRYTVTSTGFTGGVPNLFDGYYDAVASIPFGGTGTIEIDFNPQLGWTPNTTTGFTYMDGVIVINFYYTFIPTNVKVEMYRYAGGADGWQTIYDTTTNNKNPLIIPTNPIFNYVKKLKVTFSGGGDPTYGIWVTEIEWFPTRESSSKQLVNIPKYYREDVDISMPNLQMRSSTNWNNITAKITNTGDVVGTRLCIGADCRSTWPEAVNAFVDEGNVGFGPTAVLGTNDNVPLAFETNNIEKMRIDTAGNVGIGTVSPSYPLHVSSSALRSIYGYTSNGYGVYGEGTTAGVYGTGTTFGVYGSSANGFGIYGSSVSSYGVYGSSINSYAGYFSGLAGIYVQASGGYAGIFTGGNVGIGTSPSYPLHVYTTGSIGTYSQASNNAFYGYATGASGSGGWFESTGTAGATGVSGYAWGGSGTTYGVYGYAASPSGWGGYFTGGKGAYANKLAVGTENYYGIERFIAASQTSFSGTNFVNGSFYVVNPSGVQPDKLISGDAKILNYDASGPTTFFIGMRGAVEHVGNGIMNKQVNGLFGEVKTANAASTITNAEGVLGSVFPETGNITNAFGVKGRAGPSTLNSPGNVTNAYGVYGEAGNLFNPSTGSVTTAYGVYGTTRSDVVGKVTTGYGGYFSSTVATGTNYGIYATASGGTTAWAGYFTGGRGVYADKLVAGSPVDPSLYKLYVAGDGYITNNLEVKNRMALADATIENSRVINIRADASTSLPVRGIYTQINNPSGSQPGYLFGISSLMINNDVTGPLYGVVGIDSQVNHMGSGVSTGFIHGFRSRVFTGGTGKIDQARGFSGTADPGASGEIQYAYGVEGKAGPSAENSTGKVINAYGVFGEAGVLYHTAISSQVTTAYGVRGQVTEAAGTVGTGYGGYFTSMNATTNYGIYATASGGTTNWAGYFAGNVYTSGFVNASSVGIGTETTSPSAKLEIAGMGSAGSQLKLKKASGINGSVNLFVAIGDGSSRTGTALCESSLGANDPDAVCLGHWASTGEESSCATSLTSSRALCAIFGD